MVSINTIDKTLPKPLYVCFNHPGSEITTEEWEFIRAMEAYQAKFRVRYPTWREVLYVLKGLGYRKTGEPGTQVTEASRERK